jgi:hypothetical protein
MIKETLMKGLEKKNSLKNGLTPNQLRAIPCLVQNPNISEAAEQAGIARATIYEWLKIPAFRNELESQRVISYEETLAKFYSLGDLAIKAYAMALDTYEHRRAAASDFFRHLARAKEVFVNAQRSSETARSQDAVLKRLKDIEKKLAERKETDQLEPRVGKLKKRSGSKEKS